MDIRASLSPMWQLISALCQSARNSLIGGIDQFTNSTLINSMVLSEELLQAQTKADLDLAYRTASSILVRPFIAIRQITHANGFITGLLVDSVIVQLGSLLGETGQVWRKVSNYIPQGTTRSCSCQSNGSCPLPGGLYLYEAWEVYGNYDLKKIIANETLPGFIFDCLPLKMTLASSLECFYNESCLQILLSAYYPKTINVSILDNSTTSRFEPTTTIEQLINELFVEEVLNKTDYTSYYRACAPVYCSYTYSRRFDWIYVATILLALFGGLSTVLRLITPFAIKFILFLHRRRSLQVESQSNESKTCFFILFISDYYLTVLAIPIAARVRNVLLKIKQYIIKLNLFDDYSRDPLRIHRDRIATRLYVLFLTVTVSVLIMYTSISIQTISKTIQSPSQELYEVLQEQYPHTLRCPCSVVSIPYKELIEVIPIYHQLCSSDFVQPWWYESIISYEGASTESHLIYTGSSHFRTLAMFCEIANLTIVAVTHRFSSMMFTNAQVVTAELFDSQMNTLIDTLLKSTQAEFLYTMSLINAVLQANQYVSIWETNVILRQRDFSRLDPLMLEPLRIIAFSTTSETESGQICYCVRNAACNLTSILDEFSVTIEGVRSASCSILDSVLESTLTCWYSKTCFNEVRDIFSSFQIPITKNATLLDPRLPSRFPPDTPIRMIVNEIMVERWNRSVSYGNFYQNCRPTYCSFTYEARNYIVYIITTVIGLFDGFSIIFKFLSPVFVKIFFKCIHRTDPNNATQASDNQETTDRKSRISFNLTGKTENRQLEFRKLPRLFLECSNKKFHAIFHCFNP